MLPIFILVNIQISFRILVKGNKNKNNHWFDCKNFSNYCWLFLFLFLKFLWMGIISMRSDHRLKTRNRWKTFLIVKVLSPIFILVEFSTLVNGNYFDIEMEGSVENREIVDEFFKIRFILASEKSWVMKMLTFSLIPWSFLL